MEDRESVGVHCVDVGVLPEEQQVPCDCVAVVAAVQRRRTEAVKVLKGGRTEYGLVEAPRGRIVREQRRREEIMVY